MNKSMMKEEVTKHLTENIIPFWKALRDDTYGGYYGYMDYNLNVDKTAEKGCILNSRITWFFANAYILLKDETLLDEARHGYEFLRFEHFVVVMAFRNAHGDHNDNRTDAHNDAHNGQCRAGKMSR